MRRQFNRVLCLLLFCALFAGFLSGCAGQPAANRIYTTSGYSDPVSQLFPAYKIARHNMITLDLLRGGGTIEACDAGFIHNTAKHWYPLTLETVIIAVDRDQTDMAVTSWSDLRKSDVNVSILDTPPVDRMAAAALCYGLEGENFSLTAAVNLLEPLNTRKLLKFDDTAAPIQICFDSDAAARIKNGGNIDIIVPSEGTLSFVKGLLSNEPLELPDGYQQILLENGLRLTDGQCDETVYPAAEAYAAAKALEDYNHFNTVTQDWMRTLRRDVRYIRLYSSADSREHILFAVVFIIIAVIWIGSMMRRSQQRNIRRVIFIMGFIIIGWVLTRVVKYQAINEDALTRYLWYGFYIFQTLLPLGMLRIASLIGIGSENRRFPKWFMPVLSLDLVLIGLVMTNDLHGMMFKLDLSQPGWSETGNYSYGIFYFFVMAALLLQLIAGIVLIFTKIKYSPRRFSVIFSLLFTAALIAYMVGYALNIPAFAESDMTLVVSMFALLFLELCIRAGQIPVNTHYRQLFQSMGLNLQITDGSGAGVFAADGAEPLSIDQWSALSEQDTVQLDENTLLLKNKIAGGYAVWRADITAVNELKAQLEVSNKNLVFINKMLSNIAQNKGQAAQIHARTALYAAMERDIAGHERRLAEMLKKTPGDESERAVYMGIIAILVCYIKRRCQLLLSETDGNRDIELNDMLIYFDELTEFARMAGVDCLISCALDGGIGMRCAVLFYDFLGAVLEWAAAHLRGKVIIQIVSENGRIAMKLLMGYEALAFDLPAQAAQEIGGADGLFEKEDLEDMVGIVLSFPEGGERDA
ncbi:MAG: hypothetical protein FWE80_05875 [Oscillospiraceae bacterium]|nr:hypothetical protein [Oscillospiraceae bacterium]